MKQYRVPFGTIDESTLAMAERLIHGALSRKYLTEGPLTAQFEAAFARQFGWKHAIATSSGTTAGEVVWAAVRELWGVSRVATPACSFVACGSCLRAAGLEPVFVDIELDTLNMSHDALDAVIEPVNAVQFVANIGRLVGLDTIANSVHPAKAIIGDLCEAHGAKLHGELPNKYLDAAIFSLYPAHLVVGVEGGVICTDNDALVDLCRSLKSHGRPVGSTYFDFQRCGFNSKWSDLHAAVGLASLEEFPERYAKRRAVRQKLIDALSPFDDRLILYRDDETVGEEIAPHAFAVTLRDSDADMRPLYAALEGAGVQCKTLFSSLPTMHKAFAFLGHKPGDFPVAERVGRTGVHWGCGEFMTDDDIALIARVIGEFLNKGE